MDPVQNFLFALAKDLNPLFYVGFLLLLSFAGGQLAAYFKAPRVIGYLVAGVVAGSSFSGFFKPYILKTNLVLINHMALAIIAFSIGGSLEISKIKRLGKQILWITVTQAFGAFFFSTIILSLFLIITHCSGMDYTCF